MSLIHVGSNDSFAITPDGIQAGRYMLEMLANNNRSAAQKAVAIYDQIIPRENYGGEYSALRWFAQLFLMSNQEKQKALQDPFVASFYDFFADNNFANLKEYVKRKYLLQQDEDQLTEAGRNRAIFLEDFILFNNPTREAWEQTSKVLAAIPVSPGQTIADIGSGPGYYSTRFSQKVGVKGQVYSIDTVQQHLDYINRYIQRQDITNITTINSYPGTTIGLEGKQVDVAFMCSLYHNIYGMSTAPDRDSFVQSIKAALKPGGTLVLVDNGLVEPGQLPYHGPYVAKELIVHQFRFYGFKLKQEYAFIPQRYVLIFEKV
ncbi:class I SAM-dependent methyltransferase [Gloeomargarita lithophora]|nr:class I SAM-dependent methyltransferase [Gloeomargarita lithophora]